MERVVVAMSGGVDSSVAAALLRDQGYQVIGATLRLWPPAGADTPGGCCGLDGVEEARRVAQVLGIPHYVLDMADVFAQEVVWHFCAEYLRGRTPNPCVRCNRFVKFDALLHKAGELGADLVATGHYARIEQADGGYLLKKGLDSSRDQSYVLYAMAQRQLSRTLMPLGGLAKERVRQMARGLGLPVAGRAESRELCFAPDGDYGRFLRAVWPQAIGPGPILDGEGNVLGEHAGVLHYTVGQRRGLGVSRGGPWYVVAIDGERNALVVGAREEVYGRELIASDVCWIADEPPRWPTGLKARIRYRHQEADAEVAPLPGGEVARVVFRRPQLAVAPGQAVVFYRDDVVVGGGTIEQVVR